MTLLSAKSGTIQWSAQILGYAGAESDEQSVGLDYTTSHSTVSGRDKFVRNPAEI